MALIVGELGGLRVDVHDPATIDATPEMTDIETFQYLEPRHDTFRNDVREAGDVPAEHLMIDTFVDAFVQVMENDRFDLAG